MSDPSFARALEVAECGIVDLGNRPQVWSLLAC